MGDDRINSIVCDPPYGIAAVESKRGFARLSKDKVITGDHLQTEEEYRGFTRDWAGVAIPYLSRQNTMYVFGADKMIWALRAGLIESGFKTSQLLIWVKSHAVVGRLDFAPQHELILYAWHGVHRFRRSKDKSVLCYPRPAKSPYHPTTKPIGLIRHLILNSTEIGGVVFDGFLGSGTALLAGEQTKRRCLAVELDLEYCLTTIRRWEHLTGQKAKRI
ncbi:MAG: site-specific DNA-methyltransferase [bacterium]